MFSEPISILNEFVATELDASQVSVYKLEVDGKLLGKFKSSGIIVSTGTGSTGWLFSAKAISADVIARFR